MVSSNGRIRVGTAGWSYEDWHGIVYPAHPRPKDELQYLAAYFDVLEVDSSFYHPPAPKTTASWVRRTSQWPDFRFTFKMFQRFTHDREVPWSVEEASEFREGLAPVAEAGRLGAVLLQFPWSFRAEATSYDWLRRLADEFGQWPLAVEVRHDSWQKDEARSRLGELNLSVANIDQPQLEHCLRPTSEVVGSPAYVRLHGRNSRAWFAKDSTVNERFNYLYSAEELAEWVERIKAIAGRADEVYVITNNHYRGQAVANGLQLLNRLTRKPVAVPETMFVEFPFLEEIARPSGQEKLF
jgi:uncharacterized protein YecE (DUF72 family)